MLAAAGRQAGPERVLDAADRQSAAWLRLRAHLEKRLDGLRRENDRAQPAEDTAELRGRIAECKRMLALGEETPQLEWADTDRGAARRRE